MNTTLSMIGLIAGCAFVTLLPRVLPFLLVRTVRLPPFVLKWLSYIPVCILTALVVESALLESGQGTVAIDWTVVVVLIPTFLTAIRTKSLSATVVVGAIGMAAARMLL
ncbi:AzlD domain-containing protein [Paenibacillus flagellatus]|uniref:Branched-chain amino acid transporter AzlD n=1 Tax=Paenibacillus flagellatus TaxID=2211139 RepID=A0A2V5K6H3_9BACL|nr:AzlD domain-containing protein [Paenibacillus flagellatus]PYI54878.1 branched-chain amino acid transporter AzlD [Paenibacillus flagellatus]